MTWQNAIQRKDVAGCALTGFIHTDGKRENGEAIIRSIANMKCRSNGLGGGFAAYGIYPEHKDHYCFHIMYNTIKSKEETEHYLNSGFDIDKEEQIPTKPIPAIVEPPILWRYFLKPQAKKLAIDGLPPHLLYRCGGLVPDDFVVKAVMHINSSIEGAYVISSGKNMGAFKAVGFPEDVGVFYRLQEYKGWTWIGHGRFPTNTPGWWGGAHPFTLLDWAIVHNGEISSYGINKRYLEMFGYHCTLLTDTEVLAYLFDLLLRRHKLPIEIACKALTAPFWSDIDRMPEEERRLYASIRIVYGSAMVNGPFAILLGYEKGLIGLNDRIKLRPLIAAVKGKTVYMASEEAGIREICPQPDIVWAPKAGEPVIAELEEASVNITPLNRKMSAKSQNR